MSDERKTGFEPWAFGAFAVAAATAGLFLYLGFRTGGDGPVLAYRFGLLVLGWASAVSMLLALLWSLRRRPVLQRKRVWPLFALGTSLWFCSLPIAYPSSYEGKFSATRFRLPLEGSAHVRFGGERARENPLVFDPARRFGYAFEAPAGSSLRIVAPAAGTLVGRTSGRSGEVLVLATGAREFCVLDGLEPGSVQLAPGAAVDAGQSLGRAASVLYVHLQDSAELGRGEGIPMRYFGYRADGRLAEAGVPIPPQEVASVP